LEGIDSGLRNLTTAGREAEGVEMPCSEATVADELSADHLQKYVPMEFSQAYTTDTGESVSSFGGHAWDSLHWVTG
jgi:branched-chain amino acid transport system substrate-binding protein